MKKLVLTLTATLACVAAFAQGKISFQNNSLHLVYYDASNVLPADAALAGALVGANQMPSGKTLVVDLYAGASSGSLSLVSTTTFAAVAGTWTSASVTIPGIGSGTGYFQVQVRDSAYATAAESMAAGSYFGLSSVFTTVVGTSIAYNSIVNPNTPALSTWANGTKDLSALYGTSGAMGAINVQVVPEPTSIALLGLGAAGMMIFRRRK